MRLAVSGLGLLLAVTGCTISPDDPPASPSRSVPSAAQPRAASPSESTTAGPPAVVAPRENACYALRFADLLKTHNDDDPVSCAGRHSAQTIRVGILRTGDPDRARRRLATVCPRALKRFLGGSTEDRLLSRFQVVWFRSAPVEAGQDAAWFRCDVVAFSHDEELLWLPRPFRLRHVLARPAALSTYGLCGTAAPGTAGFERVICGRRHSWRAVATIPLPGGRTYPGVNAVRRAGDQRCKEIVRAGADSTLRFRYGWEWPTAEQWAAGQHHGLCWAPSR
jgi:hypothetical protein